KKRAVLNQLEASPDTMRTILGREGLYYGDVLRWREQDARGELNDSSPPPPLHFSHDVEPGNDTNIVVELETRLERLHAEIRLTQTTPDTARRVSSQGRAPNLTTAFT